MRQCTSGDIVRVAGLIQHVAPQTVILFTGGRSYEASGAKKVIESALSGYRVIRVENVRPNPTLGAVEDAIETLRSARPGLAIAVGGGSVIDLAKSCRVLAAQPEDARSIILGENPIASRGIPLIAVPTTAGTGSEATHFSVVYVDGRKHSLAHEFVRPDEVILDPELTYSVPPLESASTGFDVLSQAIESWWSVRSTDESRGYARDALELAIGALRSAVLTPDTSSRASMCEASHLAGRAIDITTTTVPHALSYELTSAFGVSHGHAVALTLGATLEYNAGVTPDDCADSRGSEYVIQMINRIVTTLGASSPEDARRLLTNLMTELGLATTLTGVGAGSIESRARIVRAVNLERLSGNPRKFGERDLNELVASVA